MKPLLKNAADISTLLDSTMQDLFLRKEEYSGHGKDEYGRFQSSSTQNLDIRKPLVSLELRDKMQRASYPEGQSFGIVLTHDIDLIYPSIPRSLLSSCRYAAKGDFGKFVNELTWRRKGTSASPYLCARQIMDIENKYDATSTFFFMAKGPDKTGAGYDPSLVKGEIRTIVDGGCEVGLHGSLEASDSAISLRMERDSLKRLSSKPIKGYRNHYLKFSVPSSWDMLAEEGFEYDSTCGFYDNVGFRDGMCYPYKPFNVTSGKTCNIWEVPLHIMDCSLYAYQGKGIEESWEIIINMMNQVESCGGVITILWHNELFANPRISQWVKVYQKLLAEGKNRNAWICGCSSLVNWWKEISKEGL